MRDSFLARAIAWCVSLCVQPAKTWTRPDAVSTTSSITRSHSVSVNVEASPVVPHGMRKSIPLSICQLTSECSAGSSTPPSRRKGVTSAVPQPINSIMIYSLRVRIVDFATTSYRSLKERKMPRRSFAGALGFSASLASVQLRGDMKLGQVKCSCTVRSSWWHIHALHKGGLELLHLCLCSHCNPHVVRHRRPSAPNSNILLQHGHLKLFPWSPDVNHEHIALRARNDFVAALGQKLQRLGANIRVDLLP